VSIRFGYDPRPHRGGGYLRRHGFPVAGFYTHFEPRHLDGPCFPRPSSRPTSSKGEVQKTVKTSSGHMIKCWIPKIYLTNSSTEPSIFSHSTEMNDGGLEIMWLMVSSCSRHMIEDAKWSRNPFSTCNAFRVLDSCGNLICGFSRCLTH
jgi:hypothetical protein